MSDREKVIEKLKELLALSRYNDSVGWNPDSDTDTLADALALLKAQEPRVFTLDEVKRFVYGDPYIIEMVLSDGEYSLMYGLFSHQGVVGNCDFVTVNERIRLYDADYGKTWRAWTGRPTPEQRWQNA